MYHKQNKTVRLAVFIPNCRPRDTFIKEISSNIWEIDAERRILWSSVAKLSLRLEKNMCTIFVRLFCFNF